MAKVFGVHQFELKPGVKPEDFEQALRQEFAKSPDLPGFRAHLGKGDRLFVDAILDDRPVTPSFFDGLKAQEVIAVAMQSHQRECWVSIAPTEPKGRVGPESDS